MPSTLIVFDIDGTLVDSSAAIVEAQRRTFAHFGLPFPGRECALWVVGLSLVEAFTAHLGPDGPAHDMAAHYRTLYGTLRANPAYGEPLFPGADDALRTLARRPDVVLGVATGKSRRGVSMLIERQGWDGLFQTIQTADDAPSKPHPAMLTQAMAETGVAPARTMMVGDSSHDMAMAAAAGVMGIGVRWGFHPADSLRAAGASSIIGDFREILSLDSDMR